MMPIRIGVLGLSHDHVWDHLPRVREHPGARLIGAADPHQQLLGRVEEEFRCRPYSNYLTLLDSEDLDAVYIFSDNASAVELAEQAASRRLHILVEKPMAADLRGAQRMLEAAHQSGVRLMVNWPFAWWPQMQHALRLAAEGRIGRVWQVRYRAAHAGPRESGCSPFFCEWLLDPARNGAGGAYMDYCCYGALLARTLLGMPSRVTAVAGRFVKDDISVDDNAVLIMTYQNGLAVSEGSWSQIGKLSAYTTVIYGTSGSLMVEPRAGGRLLLATTEQPDGAPLEVPEQPAELVSATDHFLAGVNSSSSFLPLCDPQIARDTQEILEAGLHSLQDRGEVTLPIQA